MRAKFDRLVIAMLLIALSVMPAGCSRTVPDLEGMDIVAAEQALATSGFELGSVRFDPASSAPPRTVVAQWLSSGSGTDDTERVDITVSGSEPATSAVVAASMSSSAVTVMVRVRSQETTSVVYIEGRNRYETAVDASEYAYPDGLDEDGAKTVVIATGANWPDALGGTPLAGVLDGPILLVRRSSVPAVVHEEIERLGAERAIVLGGTLAVGDGVVAALEQQLGPGSVERLAGPNRYGTADKIAARVIEERGTHGGYDGVVLIATGRNFPDALAAAPLAATKGWPLYLEQPRIGLTVQTRSALDLASSAILLGGTRAVSAETEGYLVGRYGHGRVRRIAGQDRYGTAATVARTAVSEYGMSWGGVGIATGQAFPDALTGGVVQGRLGSVMLLTPTARLSASAEAALADNRGAVSSVTFYGGSQAVSDPVRDAVSNVLR